MTLGIPVHQPSLHPLHRHEPYLRRVSAKPGHCRVGSLFTKVSSIRVPRSSVSTSNSTRDDFRVRYVNLDFNTVTPELTRCW